MSKLSDKEFRDRKFKFEYDLVIGFVAGMIVLLGDIFGDALRDQYNFRYYNTAKLLLPATIIILIIYIVRRIKK